MFRLVVFPCFDLCSVAISMLCGNANATKVLYNSFFNSCCEFNQSCRLILVKYIV